MTESSTDRIQKQITLRAPLSRVWRAISDSSEFGEWFRCRWEGPFRVGEKISGEITMPDQRVVKFEALVETMDPERLFALRWHPNEVEPGPEAWEAPTTLVEFRLEEADGGTLLTMTESGFDGLAEDQRHECFVRNERGWSEQMQNIERHLDG